MARHMICGAGVKVPALDSLLINARPKEDVDAKRGVELQHCCSALELELQ